MKPELKEYEYQKDIVGGKIVTFEMEMVPYPDHRTRKIRVYLPDAYDGVRRFPVIYMHDGQGVFRNEQDEVKIDMDRALTETGVEAIVVAIDNAETRGTELTPAAPRGEVGAVVRGYKIPVIPGESTTDLYADFVIGALKSSIDENFRTLTGPENTTIGGISAGGTTSYYMMLRNPEVFGKAIICSPGFPMFDLNGMLKILDEYDFTKLEGHKFAFYNGDQSIDVTSVDHVLAVYRKLMEKGIDKEHLMFLLDTRQSHCNEAWKKYMPEILRFLFA